MKTHKEFVIGLAFGLLLLLGGLFFQKRNSSKTDTKAIVSGTVDLNGVVEKGDTIAVAQRKVGDKKFVTIASGLEANDGVAWSWDGAKEGENYELQAYLRRDGTDLFSSEIFQITAPAQNEELAINAHAKDHPVESAIISGSFDINGHIPAGAVVAIVQKTETGEEKVVLDNIDAVDGAVWSWKQAQKGTSYQLKAYLKRGGETIGQSSEYTAVAPAQNEVLKINSTEQPPAPKSVGISGKINLNGFVPEQSSIVIMERVSGASQFSVAVDGINPADGVEWKWNGAKAGTSYEILAVLKAKQSNGTDKDVAGSQNLSVSAPASAEVLNINTGLSFPQPNPPWVHCNDQNGSNQWNVSLGFDPMPDAAQYWLELGSQQGYNDIINTKIDQTNSPELKATVNKNTTYYARWAYAYCHDCAEKNFSAFSSTVSFNCPPTPATITPMPTVTPTLTPSPTATPTITPTPVPTCRESLPADLCQQEGGTYRCLNGPCVCVCP
ncbi:MAG: hypothetical protein ABID04_02390 [Patescibacteria group bacterium]